VQLADVARPAVEEQPLHRFLGDGEMAFAVLGGRLRDEMIDEGGNLVAAFAQRPEREADDVDAVEKVFAESAAADGVFEVRIRGGDDADVDGERPRLAERRDLARLEEAQQLRLHVEAQLADLVEKERALARGSNETDMVAIGAGERSPTVAEELAFEQVARDRGAVERG
jgi:hypothetical protein